MYLQSNFTATWEKVIIRCCFWEAYLHITNIKCVCYRGFKVFKSHLHLFKLNSYQI